MRGFAHLYCGDGKGKTTAAVGLSVRASGAGKSVLRNASLSMSSILFMSMMHYGSFGITLQKYL